MDTNVRRRSCSDTDSSSIRSDHVNRHDAQRKVTTVAERTSRTVSRAPHVGARHFRWKAAATLGVGGGDSGCMVRDIVANAERELCSERHRP
jgi:hypothetical protein